MKPKTIIFIIVGILLLIFVFQNTDSVNFRFLFWHLHMSQIIMAPLLLIVGFIFGYAVAKLGGKKES